MYAKESKYKDFCSHKTNTVKNMFMKTYSLICKFKLNYWNAWNVKKFTEGINKNKKETKKFIW